MPMIDANQVWDVPHAIEHVQRPVGINLWFIEAPLHLTSAFSHCIFPLLSSHLSSYRPCTTLLTRSRQYPRSCLHSRELKPCGISVTTDEHAHTRMVSKQLLQSDVIDVIHPDSCRPAGVSEVFAVLHMAAKFGKPVGLHAGDTGLYEYGIHLR